MALPRDVGLEKDNFQKSKIYTQTESLVNYILNILLMKPGNLPSMPQLGVDITKYVKDHMAESLDTNMLKGLICSNCEDLLPYITDDNIFVGVVNNEADGIDYLIIKLPLSANQDEEENVDVYYAFYRDELNSLKFEFLVDRD